MSQGYLHIHAIGTLRRSLAQAGDAAIEQASAHVAQPCAQVHSYIRAVRLLDARQGNDPLERRIVRLVIKRLPSD
jgi:hypothetical protein